MMIVKACFKSLFTTAMSASSTLTQISLRFRESVLLAINFETARRGDRTPKFIVYLVQTRLQIKANQQSRWLSGAVLALCSGVLPDIEKNNLHNINT